MIRQEFLADYRRRAEEMVGQMTLEEKISQMVHAAPAVERVGIPSYNWWNEALHGVARAGTATVFPQPIGLAATFDDQMLQQIGDVVSTEGRAKYNAYQRQEDHGIYKGLTFWSPNVNIFRDPRWGRGHETFGEDPMLTGRMGAAYIRGLQGEDERYLKAAACAKHFAVHSGPEGLRHSFDARVSKKDLYETYLPAFQDCVDAEVEAVMGAYNRVDGEPCCGSRRLLDELLRGEMGFAGHVVSDCGAIRDFHASHGVTDTPPESAAMAVNAGCDLNCGDMYTHLMYAVEDGLLDEETIDRSVVRLMMTRLKLGMFDQTPYDAIPYSEVEKPSHLALALRAAEESVVLLKNDGLLPVDCEKIKTVALIGPNADSVRALLGNYNGTPSRQYTVLEGFETYLDGKVRILYAEGCHLYKDRVEGCAEPGDRLSEAVTAAQEADLAIVCVGLDATIEGEEGDAYNGDASGDKTDLELPGWQNELIRRVCATKTPTVVVSLSGSAVNLMAAEESANAIIQGWYPGAMGGLAIARAVFGAYSPAGRLPVTFYRSTDDLPPFEEYAMAGRTYRYYDGPVLYPFGYGLSYTRFRYDGLTLDRAAIQAGDEVRCRVAVTNIGMFDADEVVQLYLTDCETSVPAPRHQLRGFRRIHIPAGESREVDFTLRPADMELVLEDGRRVIEPGQFQITVGGGQPDDGCVTAVFHVED